MSYAEKARINGTVIQAYGICHRQVWFLSHNIFADQENESLTLGRLIDQNTYAREKHQIVLGDSKFDFMGGKNGGLVISEIKKSSRAEKASRLQLAHYLYELRKEGIDASGVLLYPTEKKRTEVVLTEELKKDLDDIYVKINEIAFSEIPPALIHCKYCQKCAYSEYCWS